MCEKTENLISSINQVGTSFQIEKTKGQTFEEISNILARDVNEPDRSKILYNENVQHHIDLCGLSVKRVLKGMKIGN